MLSYLKKFESLPIDLRKKGSLSWNFTLGVTRNSDLLFKAIEDKRGTFVVPKELKKPEFVKYDSNSGVKPPLIIGAGISGLMVAYHLSLNGYSPIIIEQGKEITDRIKDVKKLFSKGEIELNSNVYFGLGGAGTFSDGKLTTRIKDLRTKSVLETFVRCGAKEEILFDAKPHLGTDGMQKIIKRVSKRRSASTQIFGGYYEKFTREQNL
jgi:uncharacterized FAD-dependent dehydrogenase